MVVSSNAKITRVGTLGAFAKKVYELKKAGFSFFTSESPAQVGEDRAPYFEYFVGVREAIILPTTTTDEEFGVYDELRKTVVGNWNSNPKNIKNIILSEFPKYDPYYIPENRTGLRAFFINIRNARNDGWVQWGGTVDKMELEKRGVDYVKYISIPRDRAGSTVRLYSAMGILPKYPQHANALISIGNMLYGNNTKSLLASKVAMLEIRDLINPPEGLILKINPDGTGRFDELKDRILVPPIVYSEPQQDADIYKDHVITEVEAIPDNRVHVDIVEVSKPRPYSKLLLGSAVVASAGALYYFFKKR